MSSGSKGKRRLSRSRDKTPETRSRRQLQFTPAPLEGKSFFLHVQSAAKARELEKKLKELGGVVEKFLSKELTCVITDQLTVSQRSAFESKGTDSLRLSGTRGQSRAQAILQKSVRQQKQPAKGADVLTNAEKWGVKVKPGEQVFKWIDAQKKRQATAQSKGRVCSLRGAFLKVEDQSRQYKPLVKELRIWPRLNVDAAPGFSPFDEPVSMRTRSQSSSKSPRRGANRQTNQRSTGSADKKGYCELCDTHYVGMEKHVNNRQHKLVASREETYAELDRLIGRGKSLKEFEAERIKKRASKASPMKRQTRSRTRSRSPATPRSTPQKSKNTPRKPASSPRRSNPKTPSRQSRTPFPGGRTPRGQSATTSPARTRPSSPRKAPRKVTPIKIVRFEDDQYSVVKSRANKRRRDQSDNETGHSKSKRKRNDRYSIVEATPLKIRLRRSRRKGTSLAARRSILVKNRIGRSP